MSPRKHPHRLVPRHAPAPPPVTGLEVAQADPPLGNHLPEVRALYETHPYPPRDPALEHTRLLRTILDRLERIDQACFQGRRDFRQGFRVLVAGGGTGDSLVFLAEQLRTTDARIVYVDLSSASLEVARARAEVRGLAGRIEWHHASLLDLPRLGLGPFDYINCTGVLHHLEDPAAGLAALKAVLAEGGGLGLMLYGRIGRTGVYQMQELLRLLLREQPDPVVRLARATTLLHQLPATNWFKRGEELTTDHARYGDAGLQDLLLHTRDRAYTVPEVRELLEGAGLYLAGFEAPLRYRPQTYLTEAGLRQELEGLSDVEQGLLAELLAGDLITHTFHASCKPDSVARPDDLELIPYLLDPQGTEAWSATIASVMRQHPGRTVELQVREGRFRLPLPQGRFGRRFFEVFDGWRSLEELCELVRTTPTQGGPLPDRQEVLAEIVPLLQTLASADLLVLAHPAVRPFFEELRVRLRLHEVQTST